MTLAYGNAPYGRPSDNVRWTDDAVPTRAERQRQRNVDHAAPHTRKECVEKLYRLLEQRDYACEEMRRRLVSSGFDEDEAAGVVKDAAAAGLMDDDRFAETFIRSKTEAGWGQRRIEGELEHRGIILDELAGYPEAFFPRDDELERARACIAGYHGKAKDERGALYRRLSSKGFSAEICSEALREHYQDKC